MSGWVEYTEPVWRGLNMRDLKVDQAYMRIKSHMNESLWMYFLSEECYKCPYERIKHIQPTKSEILSLDVSRPLSFKVFSKDVGIYAFENETSYCNIKQTMGEFGVYNLTIENKENCRFTTDKEAVNINLPLLLVIFIIISAVCVIQALLYLLKRYRNNSAADNNSDEDSKDPKYKKRLRSLDTFRGITIVMMIFVNSGGGHYWWIDHAVWNGLHIADVVFPFFLWIMGVCIPISVKSQINRGITKGHIFTNILWRSIKLFLIGLCLNSIYGPTLENLRIMGVLQRFGIAYLISATIHVLSSKQGVITPQGRFSRITFDFFTTKLEWLVIVILVAINLGVLFGINAPGCPRGYFGPGGKHLMALYPHCTGGVVGYIDKMVLGESHIYQRPTAKSVYNAKSFDPEGLYGCLLTIVQVLFGVCCGVTLIRFTEWKSRITRWILWGLCFGVIGGILCTFSQETGWIPINKNLWSLSYMLSTTSLAFLFLSLSYFIIDVKSLWNGSPFTEAGMNAIIMYVGHTVMHKMLPWHWRIGAMNTHFMLLLECSWNTILWVLIALYLYKKKIFYSL